MPLLEGMTLVTYANPLDFKTISDIVREEKVTLMAGTPTFFWGYLRNSRPGDFETRAHHAQRRRQVPGSPARRLS